MLFKPQSYQPSISESRLKPNEELKSLTHSQAKKKKKNVFIECGKVSSCHHLNQKEPGSRTKCVEFQIWGDDLGWSFD